MKNLLVDTSAYSAFMRGHPGVVSDIQSTANLFVNPIILGELHSGFAAGGQQERNEKELESFLDSPRVRIVAIDEETSLFYATIYAGLRKAGKPIPTNDLWIAATAMQHGLGLLTLDGHFAHVEQVIVRLH